MSRKVLLSAMAIANVYAGQVPCIVSVMGTARGNRMSFAGLCGGERRRGKQEGKGRQAEASAYGVLHYCSYWRKHVEVFCAALKNHLRNRCNCLLANPNPPTFREPFSFLSVFIWGSQPRLRLYTSRTEPQA